MHGYAFKYVGQEVQGGQISDCERTQNHTGVLGDVINQPGRNTLAKHEKRLLQVCRNNSAREKSRTVADNHGCLFKCLRQHQRAVYCFGLRFFSNDYLKKLHSMDWRKKMGAEKTRRAD